MQNFSIPQASRRGFLTALGAIGAASALAASLSACGGGSGGTSTQTSAGTPAGAAPPTRLGRSPPRSATSWVPTATTR